MQAQANSPSFVSPTISVSANTKPGDTGLRRSFGSVGVAVSNSTRGQQQKQQQINKHLVNSDKNASDVAVRTSAVGQVARVRSQIEPNGMLSSFDFIDILTKIYPGTIKKLTYRQYPIRIRFGFA